MDTPPLAEPEAPEVPEVIDVDLDAMAADLDGVDAALRRLDDGTYGTCEVCTGPLTDEALAADPVIRRCPDHVGAALPSPAIEPASTEPASTQPTSTEPTSTDPPPAEPS